MYKKDIIVEQTENETIKAVWNEAEGHGRGAWVLVSIDTQLDKFLTNFDLALKSGDYETAIKLCAAFSGRAVTPNKIRASLLLAFDINTTTK